MKKIVSCFLFLFSLFPSFFTRMEAEMEEVAESSKELHHVQLSSYYFFGTKDGQNDRISHSHTEILYDYFPTSFPSLKVGVGYKHRILNWKNSDFFSQKKFSSLLLTVSDCVQIKNTEREGDWKIYWKASWEPDFSHIHHGRYHRFSGSLLNQYCSTKEVQYFWGVKGSIAMKQKKRLIPLAGISIPLDSLSSVTVLFPEKVALSRSFTSHWRGEIQWQISENFYRTKKSSSHAEKIIALSQQGPEISCHYKDHGPVHSLSSKISWGLSRTEVSVMDSAGNREHRFYTGYHHYFHIQFNVAF